MARQNRLPSYRLHRQSGQAVVAFTDAVSGRRKDHLLGKHNTAASRAEYKRVILDGKPEAVAWPIQLPPS